jgi:DNA polymerase III gamma/tau subunit
MTEVAKEEIEGEEEKVVLHGRVADIEKALEEQRKLEGKTPEQISKEKEEAEAKVKTETEAKAAEEAAKKKAEEEAKSKEEWSKEWLTTGNAHADAAISIMKEAGMKPVEGNEVFEEAIKAGDLSKVKWELLDARLGKDKAFLVRTGIENYFNTEYTAQQEVVKYAHEKVGGEAGWDKVKDWAQKVEKTDAAFKRNLDEWRGGLKLGGFAARAAVDAIKAAYEADPKNGSLTATKHERGTVTPTGNTPVEGLSRRGYTDELEKAGGDRAPKAVQEALWARRQAGMKAGI